MGTGIVLLLGMLGVGGTPPEAYPMRSRNLEIPIRVNEAARADLKELELHVSIDKGRTWTLAGRANPNQRSFSFHASTDGLYWFSVCAVDKNGSRNPADAYATPPEQLLKVLIDTVSPAIRIGMAERVGDQVQVAWETLDSQADQASLRLDYRAADAVANAPWQPIPVSPGLNQAQFRPLSNGPITLRVQINDSTGTPATALKDLPAALTAANTPTGVGLPPTPAPVMTAPAVPAPQPPPAIQQANSIAPAPSTAIAPLAQAPLPAAGTPAPAADVPAPIPSAPAPSAPTPQTEAPAGPTPLAALRPGSELMPRPPVASGTPPDLAGSPGQPSRQALPLIQHVRDRQVQIEFDVERKGPSGIKKIEVYMTWDDGQSWTKWPDPSEVSSPIQLALPEREGQYGFRLVLISGANRSEGPPRPSDIPQVRLLVDWTAPEVKIYPPILDPNQPNALVLRYKADDLNLVPTSVTLQYSKRYDGGWTPINASAHRASSLGAGITDCTWTLPSDIPDGVYLKLSARDQAGNSSEFITAQPVTVDLNKPTAARVKVVTPANQVRQ